jgi:hypothetical protein
MNLHKKFLIVFIKVSAGLEREGGKAGESESSNFCEAGFFRRRIKRSTDKVVFALWTNCFVVKTYSWGDKCDNIVISSIQKCQSFESF